MKICVITCYNQPNYIRTRTILAGLRLIHGVNTIEITNKNVGLLRYFEVFYRVAVARITHNPDVYLLAFRGYEMLLPIRLLSFGKPLIYDEYINPIEWVVKERRQVEASQKSGKLYSRIVAVVSRVIVFIVSSRLFAAAYRFLLSTVELVLADTKSHAEVSAKLTGIKPTKLFALPVGTDENTFNVPQKERRKNEKFTVFYYGSMLPLHGLQHVIDAAAKLKNEAITFVLIGGNAKIASDVRTAVQNGANIDYRPWVEFDQLPELMRTADLCLAGPFGNTFQAQYVITGKQYQYLAMGRPTVIGKNKESHVFSDKNNTLIVPQADSDALVVAIRWASAHSKELQAIGESGRRLYEKEFSTERITMRLREALVLVGFAEFGSSAEREQNKK